MTDHRGGFDPAPFARFMSQERRAGKSRTWLYRLRNASGDLLYVGISVDWRRRLRQHRRSQPWWSQVADVHLELHPTWRDASWAEGDAIRQERPTYNVAPGSACHGSVGFRVPPMADIWQSVDVVR